MRERVDYPAGMRRHDSPAVRLFFLPLGTLFLTLGVAGVFLPVLPTTPFALLAAGCYARLGAFLQLAHEPPHVRADGAGGSTAPSRTARSTGRSP